MNRIEYSENSARWVGREKNSEQHQLNDGANSNLLEIETRCECILQSNACSCNPLKSISGRVKKESNQ